MRKPLHDKSCSLDSLALLLEVPQSELLADLEHDGSETGFHIQELVYLARLRGHDLCVFERWPSRINPVDWSQTPVKIPGGNDIWFAEQMMDQKGILEGYNKNNLPHAVAWMGGFAVDPAGDSFSLLEVIDDKPVGIVEREQFHPAHFWKLIV